MLWGIIDVRFCWVPNHDKTSSKFSCNGVATPWQLRLWNRKADEAAVAVQRARAGGSARDAWFVTKKAAKEWETKAVSAFIAAAHKYHDYVTVL